jgi:gliding motility-associated-like protein
MSNVFRLLLFVPPALLFFFPAFSQLQGKIESVPGSNTYHVSVIPLVNWSVPQSIISSAQLTLRVPEGSLNITDFQSINGNWSQQAPVHSPVEAPGYDYFSFTQNAPNFNLTFVSGTPLPMFSFKNSLGCTYVEIVDNQTDPFLPPNSISVNIGNSFAVLGAGVGNNAYSGNSAAFFVECPPLGFLPSALNNPVRCHNDLTDLTLSAFGGKEPYQVNWNNLSTNKTGVEQIPVYDGSVTLNNMSPGTYVFTIKDALDSLLIDTFLLKNPAQIQLELASFDASCNGSLDGVAYVSHIQGGTIAQDYQYLWETNPAISSESVGFLNPGVYSVTVSDDNGCQVSDSVEVSTFVIFHLNPIVRNISCFNASDGVVDLYPVGSNPPFTFTWSSNVTTGAYSSAWQLGPGNFQVTVTDATGVCFETGIFTVEEPPAIEVNYQLDEPVCFGDKGYVTINGVENTRGVWNLITKGGQDLGNGKQFEVEAGSEFSIKIEDGAGCSTTDEVKIPVREELLLELGENYQIKYGEEIDLTPAYYPYNNVRFQWLPAVGLSCSDCPYPVASPKESVTYHLIMTDSLGCKAEDRVSFNVRKSRDVYIPTAFSPNHDGVNDVFCPYGGFEVVSIKSMQVFDRWGGLLFENPQPFPASDYRGGWDGTFRGKPMDGGVYLYMINVEFIDGEVVLYAGEVNLMQ